MQSAITTSPLADFLTQPEIESFPAWEFINGQAEQKPMPSLFHSRIQRNLINTINAPTVEYEAIQELRCIVLPLSPVPDITVIARSRLPNEDGPFNGSPDWIVEIWSPDQSTLDQSTPLLQSKILHFLSNGTQLAWLIDSQRRQVWVWQGEELPIVYAGDDLLPTLGNLQDLSVRAVMAMTLQQ